MSWTGKKVLKTLRVDADFFENGEKNLSFSKIFGYVWASKNDFKALNVNADFFENGEKNLSFSKYSNTPGQAKTI